MQDKVTVDAAQAAALTAPADGAALPARDARPPSPGSCRRPSGKHPRHGVESGRFVWLELSGGGLAESINVLSLGDDQLHARRRHLGEADRHHRRGHGHAS